MIIDILYANINADIIYEMHGACDHLFDKKTIASLATDFKKEWILQKYMNNDEVTSYSV